jgi:SHS2 domain-containing protein
MGGYRFLDDVAIADVAFEAWGDTLADLFAACGQATFAVMVDLEHVEPRQAVQIELANETLEGLLFEWLAELVFRKDAHSMFFARFQVTVDQVDGRFVLTATAAGEPIRADLPMRLDVKAPTAHMLEVTRSNEGWRTRVVLDV